MIKLDKMKNHHTLKFSSDKELTGAVMHINVIIKKHSRQQ